MISTRVKRTALLLFIVWIVFVLFFIHVFYNSALSLTPRQTGLGELGVAVSFDKLRKSLFTQYGFDSMRSDYISVNRQVPKGTRNGRISERSNVTRKWLDEREIQMALAREGRGERGSPVKFDELRSSLYKEYGYDAIISDEISLDRSVPDVRPSECKNRTYLAELPKASIIIIFYNERLSVLLRTVHGIINRSQDELIHEIILVDDCSTNEELLSPLTEHLHFHLPPERSKVRLIRLPKRGGLMVARMSGARAASKESKVLLFMDAHFEVNYNWLPPLLEPIAINPKACTAPGLDRISFQDFQYTADNPFRGVFDWTLYYYFFPLLPHEYDAPAKNRPEYILMGAAIAIGADFFWELGGFDEGMILWGGEQFELSFKIWMCGGEILIVPCSRMAHLYRDGNTKGNTNLYGNYNFLGRNYRRFMDVCMDDEYRQHVFRRRPDLKNADPGNLTDRLAILDRLNCKNFSWMMDTVMTDIIDKFPPIEPLNLAWGQWRSILDPNLCISVAPDRNVSLESCANKSKSGWEKDWVYNWRGEMKVNGGICLDSFSEQNRTRGYQCHMTKGNQKWYYDRKKKWIAQVSLNKCLVANTKERLVHLLDCDENDSSMKWTVTHTNVTQMDQFEPELGWNSK